MNRSAGTILLVEDDDNDLELFLRAYGKARIANPVHRVANGDEAVDYIAGNGKYASRDAHPLPVLILLDLKLPRRSGLEVLEWIRTSGHKRVPVVVLTSSKESSDINRAYDLGANSYLVKPVGFDNLFDLIRSLNLYWLVLNQKPA